MSFCPENVGNWSSSPQSDLDFFPRSIQSCFPLLQGPVAGNHRQHFFDPTGSNTITIVRRIEKKRFFRVRPMTMETRCSKVIFPNYLKKKTAEDTLVPPLWGTREKNVCFSRIICSRCCTRRNLRFHVENCQHADQKQLT